MSEIIEPEPITPPVLSDVTLAWATDFLGVSFEQPYRLKGLGILDNPTGNFIVGIGAGNGEASLIDFASGRRCLKLHQINTLTDLRIALALFVRTADHKVIGKEFLFEQMLYIAPDNYVMGSPTNKWININMIFDMMAYTPYWQVLWYGKSPVQSDVEEGTQDLIIDHRKYGSGYEILSRVKNYPLPVGRWFKLSWYMKFDGANGRMKLWIDDELLVSLDGLLTEDNPNNTESYFAYAPAKLYGDPDGTFPRTIYVSDIKLYNITESPPIETYSLEILESLEGTTTPTGSIIQNMGSTLEVMATPAEGFKLNYWLLDGENIGNINPYTVIFDADHVLEPIFIEETEPPPTGENHFLLLFLGIFALILLGFLMSGKSE